MIINSFAAETRGSILSPFTYEAELTLPLDCKIEIETCGICHSDIHMIDNDWRSSVYPFVGGHEIVGKVVEIGTDCIRVKMSNDVISRIDEYDFFILSPEQITEYLINK